MKEIAKLCSAQNVRNMIIKYMFAKINNAAHIVRKNINSRNIFIKKNVKMTMRVLQENSQNV